MDQLGASTSNSSVILVVDDETTNRILLQAYLTPAHRVIEAPDGAAAIDAVRRSSVDLVLLDVMMPKLGGLEACREIKRLTRGRFLPVILLTALNDQEDRNAGLEAGADDFLTKPFDRRELLLRVNAFLRMRDQEATIHRQLEELRQLQALKDDLFHLIVHDLRNPLSGVVGFLELLAEPQGRGNPDYVRQALGAARRLGDTLDGVLTVRTLEEDKLALRPEPFDLRELARDAVASLEGALRTRRIAVALAPGGELVVEVDGALVRRAIENVIANAVKYSRSGQPVDVRVAAEDDAAVVEVADRGPGVPEELKSEIFEKFVTVEAAVGARRRGYGLGLYLVKLVALAHGGNVSVLDREGGGSIFRLCFPRAREEGSPA